jgi:hypothetical protein
LANSKMQRVELCTFYDIDLHCPFCGQKVVNYGSNGSEPGVTPCLHTVFSASDEGFDYRCPEFNAFFKLDEEDDVDVDELGFDHIDAMTDAFEAVDGIKFAQYVAPPGGIGGYVGFVPKDVE